MDREEDTRWDREEDTRPDREEDTRWDREEDLVFNDVRGLDKAEHKRCEPAVQSAQSIMSHIKPATRAHACLACQVSHVSAR